MKADIEIIQLISPSSGAIDISDLVAEVNIFQDIFKHHMECEIVVIDNIGLDRALLQDLENNIAGGFTGQEFLLIQYSSAANPLRTHLFNLYKRSSRSRSNNTDAYILSGVSVEALEIFPRKISQAFGGEDGKPISDMITNVIKQNIDTEALKGLYGEIADKFKTAINKSFKIEKTNGKHKFVIPNLTVDSCIDFLCNEADSDDHIPNYMFYEDQNGYNFRNLSSLTQQEPVGKYVFNEFNLDTFRGQLRMIDYHIEKEKDILEQARDGLFKSKTILIDTLKKNMKELMFDYQKEFDKFKTLQQFKHFGNVADPNVNVTMLTTRNGHDEDELFVDEKHRPKKVERLVGAKRSYRNHLFKQTMVVTVPGTTVLNVGNIIYLSFPTREGLDDSQQVIENKGISGKYIITEIRNQIKNNSGLEFITVFKCVRDTEIEENN